jgi:serine/threonine protein kinase
VYGKEADLWSLGIITFECLVGIVPFHAGKRRGPEAIAIVQEKIVDHHADLLLCKLRKALGVGLMSYDAAHFLLGVVCVARSRLTAEKMRAHPFFADVDFMTLRDATPPIKPVVSGPDDCRWFDDFDPAPLPAPACTTAPRDVLLEWAHYEFDRELHDSQLPIEEVDSLFF